MSPNELTELAPIAATLNQESNEINQIIASLNREIAALNLGITVWLDQSESDPQYCVGFTQIGEGEIRYTDTEEGTICDYSSYSWQLAIRRQSASSSTEEKPLLKASRNLRIEALQHAPDIIYLLKKEAENKIAAIRNAKKLVSELSTDTNGILKPTETLASLLTPTIEMFKNRGK